MKHGKQQLNDHQESFSINDKLKSGILLHDVMVYLDFSMKKSKNSILVFLVW